MTHHRTPLVMNLKFWHCHDRVTAIEGLFPALLGAGAIKCDNVPMSSIEEGLKDNHVACHLVGQFEDLWLHVRAEGI